MNHLGSRRPPGNAVQPKGLDTVHSARWPRYEHSQLQHLLCLSLATSGRSGEDGHCQGPKKDATQNRNPETKKVAHSWGPCGNASSSPVSCLDVAVSHQSGPDKPINRQGWGEDGWWGQCCAGSAEHWRKLHISLWPFAVHENVLGKPHIGQCLVNM